MIDNYLLPIGIILFIVVGILLMIRSIRRIKKPKRRIKIKRRKKMTEEENPKKKGYNPGMYKPKLISQKDMQESMKGAMKKRPEQQTFKSRPLFRQTEKYPQPREPPYYKPMQRQTTLEEHRREPEPKPEREPEEEPYWSPEEWESWAMEIYKQYPEIRQFLPDWFIQAMEG